VDLTFPEDYDPNFTGDATFLAGRDKCTIDTPALEDESIGSWQVVGTFECVDVPSYDGGSRRVNYRGTFEAIGPRPSMSPTPSFVRPRGTALPATSGSEPAGGSSPVTAGLIGVAVLLALAGFVVLRRTVFAPVPAGPGLPTDSKPRRRGRGGSHGACVTRWHAASSAGMIARTRAGRELQTSLVELGEEWTDATAALETAARSFRGLSKTDVAVPRRRRTAATPEVVLGRILDGLSSHVGGEA
jgi:hypothetical protein